MMPETGRDSEAGVVLINVLAVVALASAVAITMLTLADAAIRRSQRFSDAAQAAAYALGGEASAVAALRRDAEQAPDADHRLEAWGTISQTEVEIEGGLFSLTVEDAQGRFNLNNLDGGGLAALDTLRKIAVSLDLPEDTAERALALIELGGPLLDLRELRAAGLDEDALQSLSSMVTTLPARAEVNLNAVGEPLLGVLLGNPVAARFLVARRDRVGFLDRDDFAATRILPPPGVGFKSDHFRVTVDVTVGDTAQRVTSLLQRRRARNGGSEVVAVERKRERAAP